MIAVDALALEFLVLALALGIEMMRPPIAMTIPSLQSLLILLTLLLLSS